MYWKRYILSPIVSYIKHISISSLLILFVYFVVNHDIEQEKSNSYPNVFLMGQFNYFSYNVTTWINTWSSVIDRKNIIVAAPCPYPERCIADNIRPYPSITPSKYNFYVFDMGYHSPFINIATVIRKTANLDGILMIHDDLLLHPYILEKVGGNEWVVSNFDKGLISFYENSTIDSSRDLEKIRRWYHWPECSSNFTKMFHDGRLKPYMHRSRNKDLYINVATGQSDMLYAFFPNFELKHAFLNLLELFTEWNLWLECAIPTAVAMMQERYGIKVHNTPLCTHWGELRKAGRTKEMFEQCSKEMLLKGVEKYGTYHPIKLGWNNDWIQYFEYVKTL